MSHDILRPLATPPPDGMGEREGTTDFSVIRTVGREGVRVARCVILEWVPRWVNCYEFSESKKFPYNCQVFNYTISRLTKHFWTFRYS